MLIHFKLAKCENLTGSFLHVRLVRHFMRKKIWLPLVAILLIAAQDPLSIGIISPRPGETVSGQVTVTGITDVIGFTSSQLDFSYASNSTDTWFALQTSSLPEVDAPLAVWDTTMISDGEYILRLRVYVNDGTFQEVLIPIKIQNDTPIPTSTAVGDPSAGLEGGQVPTPFLLASSPTPTRTPRPTPTPFPSNGAELKQNDVYMSLVRGTLVILGMFILAGLMIRFRRY